MVKLFTGYKTKYLCHFSLFTILSSKTQIEVTKIELRRMIANYGNFFYRNYQKDLLVSVASMAHPHRFTLSNLLGELCVIAEQTTALFLET